LYSCYVGHDVFFYLCCLRKACAVVGSEFLALTCRTRPGMGACAAALCAVGRRGGLLQGLFYFCHGGRPFVVGCRKGTSSAPSCASTRGASAQRLLAAWPFCLRSELDTLFRHDKTNHPRRPLLWTRSRSAVTQRTRSCVEVAENSFSQPLGFGFELRADAEGGGGGGGFAIRKRLSRGVCGCQSPLLAGMCGRVTSWRCCNLSEKPGVL